MLTQMKSSELAISLQEQKLLTQIKHGYQLSMC